VADPVVVIVLDRHADPAPAVLGVLGDLADASLAAEELVPVAGLAATQQQRRFVTTPAGFSAAVPALSIEHHNQGAGNRA
jgi:hypothetical protein